MIGTKLAHYEITSHLGTGGMGEVYQASDSRLGRSVAIKLLPEAFARDADRLARFEREARVLASLNHPHIAAIYGLEESGGRRFLVMELVGGKNLAERIKRGPIPVDEALGFAKQIVEALEAAHEKSIIHRDLKPGNVMITPEGKVKVLDFGLAKALETSPANTTLSNSPTLTFTGTNAGVILGTAAYMAPEQARGRAADQRSDVFSFGCVLYEMLTGRQAFQGEDISDVLASVLKTEPDFDLLPPKMNRRLREVLRRCLEKNPKERWQAIGDVRIEIQNVISDPHDSNIPAVRTFERRPIWKRAIPVAVTAIVVAAFTFAITWSFRPSAPAIVARFPFVIPKEQRFNNASGRHVLAISPSGTDTVYVADDRLYLRKLEEMDSQPIQGGELNVNTPFFSPDGRWLAFYSNSENKLMKIAVTGGASVPIGETPRIYGGSWSRDNFIIMGAGSNGILRISANGGKPETIIHVEANEEAQSPQLLPDGDSVLFTLAKGGTNAPDRWDKAQVVVRSLKTGHSQVLFEGGSDARYMETGHILYRLGSNLLAVPFDARNIRITGGPVTVLEGVSYSINQGVAQISVSSHGTVVYVPDGGNANGGRILVQADRTGQTKTLPFVPGSYLHPRISPNGKQLVLAMDDAKDATAIWIYDLGSSTSPLRLTFGSANRYPLWTPDGERIVFQSNREKDRGLFWQRADGSGTAERLTTAEGKAEHAPQAWLPDRKTLIFSAVDGGNEGSLWSVSLEPGSKPKLLIDRIDAANQSASLSTDGHWIAYTLNESGRNIFVQPVPPTGAKYQITTEGGISPIWSPDGKQLIYSQSPGSGIGNLMLVDVETRPSFVFGKPTPLPIKGFWHNGAPGNPRGFDITPDGKQFIVMRPPDESNPRALRQINFIVNWFDELKQRVPVH